MSNFTIKEIHISQLRAGDTILHNDGNIRTVCAKDIKRGGFCGDTVFGDSYKSGHQKVQLVQFTTNKSIRGKAI